MEHTMAPEVKEALLGRWEPVYRSQLHYMITWSTRGRRPVLKDRHIDALRGLIERLCDERAIELLEFAAAWDHVHVLVALRPSQSVSSVVRELKGTSGMMLLREFPELRVWLRGNLVWDERYAAETVSSQRVERLRDRLRTMHAPEERLARAS